MRRTPILFWPLALMASCTGSPDPDEGSGGTGGGSSCEVFSAGLTQLGDEGNVSVILESSLPAPPERGNNEWTVQLKDANAAPVSDATITITPYMPKHGHGSSVKATITPLGDGRYSLNPVNFPMAGLWEVTIGVTLATGDTDKTMFTICIAD